AAQRSIVAGLISGDGGSRGRIYNPNTRMPSRRSRTDGEKSRDQTMTFEAALGQALQSDEPLQKARSLAQQLVNSGQSKQKILEQFEQSRQRLRKEGKEREEDVLLDVMDFIEGWCSPPMK